MSWWAYVESPAVSFCRRIAPKPMPAMVSPLIMRGPHERDRHDWLARQYSRHSADVDKGRAVSGGAQDAVVGTHRTEHDRSARLVVLLGDMVPSSTKGNWRAFGDQFAGPVIAVFHLSALRRSGPPGSGRP